MVAKEEEEEKGGELPRLDTLGWWGGAEVTRPSHFRHRDPTHLGQLINLGEDRGGGLRPSVWC